MTWKMMRRSDEYHHNKQTVMSVLMKINFLIEYISNLPTIALIETVAWCGLQLCPKKRRVSDRIVITG
jgi:hypothetical protein